MAKAKPKSITPAEGERSGPVTMTDALERLLPHCDGNPHKVAARLDAQHRDDDVFLLGGGVAIPPESNPSMLGIKAHIPPAGPAFLYVQLRAGRPPGPVWDVGMTLKDLGEHHRFWTFERKSFEDHFPSAPKNRGGRPPVFTQQDRENILVEAAVAVYEEGLPDNPLTLEGLSNAVAARLGDASPGLTLLKEILGPLWRKLKAAQSKG
jgi:hypothetical protein